MSLNRDLPEKSDAVIAFPLFAYFGFSVILKVFFKCVTLDL